MTQNRSEVSVSITERAAIAMFAVVSLSSLIVVGMIDVSVVDAQSVRSRDSKGPQFEVASIKRSTDQSFTGMDLHPGGRLTANAPLIVLIANAYRVKHHQILRGPAWINSEIYKVEAKTGGSESASEILLALQALLKDRFKLLIERQTRELGVYALGRIRLQGQGVSVADFVERLSNFVDRPVMDRTGYTSKFDIDLEFVPDAFAFARLGGVVIPGESPVPASDENSPLSLSTAVRERGLKLESAKGPVDVLIIDHVERPSAN